MSRRAKGKRPTAAQRWVLKTGLTATVHGGYGGPSVVRSFSTGLTTYGARTDTVHRCRVSGWLDEAGRTTEAGKAALDEVNEAEAL